MTKQMPSDNALTLLSLDLEAGSGVLIDYAVRQANRCGDTIHIVHVAKPGQDRQAREFTHEKLEQLVKAHTPQGTQLSTEIRSGTPEESIPALAAELGASIIILGRRRRSDVERIYVGSTTSAVISDAPCAVLVVPLTRKDK